ncbi:hypothetical protein D3C73_976900 [compost metagenome]
MQHHSYLFYTAPRCTAVYGHHFVSTAELCNVVAKTQCCFKHAFTGQQYSTAFGVTEVDNTGIEHFSIPAQAPDLSVNI